MRVGRCTSQGVIERIWSYTWRLRSSELKEALGDRDQVNSEMHSEVGIEHVWACTKANIKWTQRCTWRPRSIIIAGD